MDKIGIMNRVNRMNRYLHNIARISIYKTMRLHKINTDILWKSVWSCGSYNTLLSIYMNRTSGRIASKP